MALALYVHIPFCRSKCPYCDFVSFPGIDSAAMGEYAAALTRELSLRAAQIELGQRRLTTIYIGGGTPTLWPGSCWAALWEVVRLHFTLPDDMEVTVEGNPGSVELKLLKALRCNGVTRLSLGAQSFQPRLLSLIGRCHDAADIRRTVAIAREAGFKNFNLDLIYGLPTQTPEEWRADLEEALKQAPEHLSAYELQLDPSTPWGQQMEAGCLKLPSEDDRAIMYDYARRRLAQQGFDHYEISNWARPGRLCRHNLTYWRRRPYLGIGVSASSFLGGLRWTNTASLSEYLIETRAGRFPTAFTEQISPRQAMAETMFLGLRLKAGIDKLSFEKEFGKSMDSVFGEPIRRLKQQGLLSEREGRLSLTGRGLLLGNVVFREFVQPEE